MAFDPAVDLVVGFGPGGVKLWDSESEFVREHVTFSCMLVNIELKHFFAGTPTGEVRVYPWPLLMSNLDNSEYT